MNNLFWQFYVDKRTEHFYNTLDIQNIKQNGLWNKKKSYCKKKDMDAKIKQTSENSETQTPK